MPPQVNRVAAAVVLTAVGFVSAAADARGAGEKSLRWKFETGQKAQYQMTQETVIDSEFEGKKIQATMKQVIDATRLVESVDDKGAAEMMQTMDRMQVKTVGGPEGDIDYDSDSAEPPKGIAAEVAPVVKAIIKKPFRIKMSALGELSDPKLPDEFTEAVKEAASKEPALAQMGEVVVKQMVDDSGLIFPVEPVKKGATWQKTTEIDTPTGKGKLTREYTYLGEEDHDGRTLQKIGAKVETTLGDEESPQFKFDVISQDSKGSMLFDDKTGRLIDGTVTTKVKTKVSGMGMEVVQQITTTATIKLVSSGKAAPGKTPASEKPPAGDKSKTKPPVKKN